MSKEEVARKLLRLALGHAPLPSEDAARVTEALALQGDAPDAPGAEERWRLEAAQVRGCGGMRACVERESMHDSC